MKILLNCLPPADVHTPSISLSILKSFMQEHGYEVDIKYWNFLWTDMSDYIETEDTEIRLLPFLSILNDMQNNAKGNARILSLLQKLNPTFKADYPDYYSEFLEDKKKEIYEIMHTELDGIDFSEVLLFGITAKYNQWIPGIILADAIKKINPKVKIVVGGFGNEEVAKEAMKLCPNFDFVTWGEGEYPLLHLAEQLYNKLNNEVFKYNLVPRLIYKEANILKQSDILKSEYLDFNNYIYPDYKDFIDAYPYTEDMEKVSIPINTIRSCHWRKCQFCDFNSGYKLRSRKPECVVAEIEQIIEMYGLTTFSFVDSDTFGNLLHFEKLVDLIIDLKYRSEEDLVFWAEIIPNAYFSAQLMEKMAIAGFKNIFIGYDALSDELLRKMHKSNSFSDNLFFVKYAIKNGIAPYVNVIKHVLGETEEDVLQCIDNLHFLRFFYNNSTVSFSHNYVTLVLSSMTKYYKALSSDERKFYDYDPISYLLPKHFSDGEERFHLFRYESSTPSNLKEWDKLITIEDYYKTNTFSYKFQENNGVYYYTEYCNNEEIANVVFGEPEYSDVLKFIEKQVCSLSDLFQEMKINYPEINEKRLVEILTNLKKSYLIYFNKDFSNIISVVEL